MSAPALAAAPAAGSRIMHNATMLAGSQVVTWTLAALWTLYVPRAIGPRGMGELTTALAATAVLGVVGLSLGTLLVKEMARDRSLVPGHIGSAVIVQLIMFGPLALLMAGYIQLSHFGPEQSLVIWLMTAAVPLGFVTGAIQAGFQAIERMEYMAYSSVLQKAVLTAAGTALVFAGLGVISLAALGLVIAGVILILNVLWMRRHFGVDWRFDPLRLRHLVIGCIPFVATAVSFTAYQSIDSMMLAAMTSPAVVGWYGVGNRLVGALLVLPVILSTAWFPSLSSAHLKAQLKAAARPALELTLLTSLPIAVGLALIADPLVERLYGPAFLPSAPVLIVLAACVPPTALNIMLWRVLTAADRQRYWAWVMTAALVINVALNVVLIPFFQHTYLNGAIGASTAFLTSEVLMSVAGLVAVRQLLGRSSLLRLLRGALATAGMGAVVFAVQPLGLAVQILIGAAVFALLAVLLRVLTLAELSRLRELRGARGGDRTA